MGTEIDIRQAGVHVDSQYYFGQRIGLLSWVENGWKGRQTGGLFYMLVKLFWLAAWDPTVWQTGGKWVERHAGGWKVRQTGGLVDFSVKLF